MGNTRRRAVLAAALSAAVLASAACKEKAKEEVLQTAEDEARLKAERMGRQAEGIGEGLQDAGKKGARSLSKGVGDVLRGSAQGFDASLAAVEVRAGSGIAEAGLRIERASRTAADTISVYLLCDRPFAGTLMLRAQDDAGREVGRAKAAVERDADDADYVDFAFDARAPITAITSFELSVRQADAAGPSPTPAGRAPGSTKAGGSSRGGER